MQGRRRWIGPRARSRPPRSDARRRRPLRDRARRERLPPRRRGCGRRGPAHAAGPRLLPVLGKRVSLLPALHDRRDPDAGAERLAPRRPLRRRAPRELPPRRRLPDHDVLGARRPGRVHARRGRSGERRHGPRRRRLRPRPQPRRDPALEHRRPPLRAGDPARRRLEPRGLRARAPASLRRVRERGPEEHRHGLHHEAAARRVARVAADPSGPGGRRTPRRARLQLPELPAPRRRLGPDRPAVRGLRRIGRRLESDLPASPLARRVRSAPPAATARRTRGTRAAAPPTRRPDSPRSTRSPTTPRASSPSRRSAASAICGWCSERRRAIRSAAPTTSPRCRHRDISTA